MRLLLLAAALGTELSSTVEPCPAGASCAADDGLSLMQLRGRQDKVVAGSQKLTVEEQQQLKHGGTASRKLTVKEQEKMGLAHATKPARKVALVGGKKEYARGHWHVSAAKEKLTIEEQEKEAGPLALLQDPKVAIINDDSCRYANDGACDEPTYCYLGTDCTDCGHCGQTPQAPPAPAPDQAPRTSFTLVSELSEGRMSDCTGIYPCGPDGCPSDNLEHCESKCLAHGCNTVNFRASRCHLRKCDRCTRDDCSYTTEHGGAQVLTNLAVPGEEAEEKETGPAANLFMATLAEGREGAPCSESPVAIDGNAAVGNLGHIDCPSGTCPPESCHVHCKQEPLCKFVAALKTAKPGEWDCTAYAQCTPPNLTWEIYEKELSEAAEAAEGAVHSNTDANDATPARSPGFMLVSELSEGRASACHALHPCGPDGCPSDNLEGCEAKALSHGGNTVNYGGGRCYIKVCTACTADDCSFTTEDGAFDVYTALNAPDTVAGLWMGPMAEHRTGDCTERPVSINGNSKEGNLGHIDCPSNTCPPETCQISCEEEPLCKFVTATKTATGWDCTAYDTCTPAPLKWQLYEKEVSEDVAAAEAELAGDPAAVAVESTSTADDSCVYANDGACDEPTYCVVGTDCTDCGNCAGGAAPAIVAGHGIHFAMVSEISDGQMSDCTSVCPCGADGCPSDNLEHCERKCLEYGCNTVNFRSGRCQMRKCDKCTRDDCSYSTARGGFQVFTALALPDEKPLASAKPGLFMGPMAEGRAPNACTERPAKVNGSRKKANLGHIDCPSGTCPPESCQVHCEEEQNCKFVLSEKTEKPGEWDCTAYEVCTPPALKWVAWEKESSEDVEASEAAAAAEPDDSCAYAKDGACDEPTHCNPGTDCTDCGNCAGTDPSTDVRRRAPSRRRPVPCPH